MQVFLTSATGQLGQLVAQELQRAGCEVSGVTRRKELCPRIAADGIRPVLGSMLDLSMLAEESRISDCVIHTVFYHGPDTTDVLSTDADAIKTLIENAKPGSRLILCSTARVFGSQSDPISEGTPAPANERSKIEEGALHSREHRGRDVHLVRLPVLRVGGESLGPVLRRLVDVSMARNFVPVVGSGDNSLSLARLEDAANRIVELATSSRPASVDGVSHIAVAGEVSQRDVSMVVAGALGKPLRILDEREGKTQLGSFAASQLRLTSILRPLDDQAAPPSEILSTLKDQVRHYAGLSGEWRTR